VQVLVRVQVLAQVVQLVEQAQVPQPLSVFPLSLLLSQQSLSQSQQWLLLSQQSALSLSPQSLMLLIHHLKMEKALALAQLQSWGLNQGELERLRIVNKDAMCHCLSECRT
jgi:DNA replication protein DnaD